MATDVVEYRPLRRIVRAELRGRKAVAIMECGREAGEGPGLPIEQEWNACACFVCPRIEFNYRQQPEHFGWKKYMAIAINKHDWATTALTFPNGRELAMTYCTRCGYSVLGDQPPHEAGSIVEHHVVMQGPPPCEGTWMGFHGPNCGYEKVKV